MDKLRRQNRDIFAIIDEEFIDAEGRLLSAKGNDADAAEYEPVDYAQSGEFAETVVSEDVAEYANDVALTEADVEGVEKKKVISKTFAQKMLEASDVLQDRYDELLNYASRFKRVKARISRKFDSINQGRLQFVKLSVAGKTLKLYLNMDINTVDPKFHCKDMSDKKTYVTVPVLLRIKSGRAVKYAKILIDQCAELYGFKENKKYQEVDAISRIEAFQQAKEDKK
ncbi:MAG: hypothetical protein ACI4M6_02475 [Christensenellaceae bacterium]